MAEDAVTHEHELAAFIDHHDFLSWLDLQVELVESDRVVMRVPFDEKLTNPAPGSSGSVHGGILASIVDTASGFALRTTFDDPTDARLTTTDLNVSYLRPATGDLVVDADVVRAGGSMGVTDATVESTTLDGGKTEVAVGRTSYRLFRED